MAGCGAYLGSAAGYNIICGHLWCGSIALCDDCKEKRQRKRILDKQEALLDVQLKKSES